ncbi:MAG: M20/M25/M40 family metallo-hydrolase [Kiritimatiellae bacterium]|nr:M20/M25/M40 family metallo-hydrolase [Kiritimatiellia bacterium]
MFAAIVLAAMMTPFGEKVTAENAWREYPRPQMVRANWQCMNGEWRWQVTKVAETAAMPEAWQEKKILVPFAIESPLSGIGRLMEEDEYLWYRRSFTVAKRRGERIILHLDAVDFRAQVFVGHHEVDIPHESANVPIIADITDFAKDGENELTVCVWDPTELGAYGSTGKQIHKPQSCFYTRSSGIVGSVWTENVPETYIRSYKVTPDIDAGTVRFDFDIAGSRSAEIEVAVDGCDPVRGMDAITVKMPAGFRLWSPEEPNLYDFTARCGKDSVKGYFGMRKFEKRKDAKGALRFFLNNRPYYILGTLDQGWWPDGLLTPPSDEAMEFDIRALKEYGFNSMRKHIKVESLRYYYHCDRLGLLLLQDMPCDFPEDRHDIPGGHGTDTVRYGFYRHDWKRVMDHLMNVVSIGVWIPYNEAWGQPREFLTHSTLDWTARYDPTRLVNGPSGWNDYEGGNCVYEAKVGHWRGKKKPTAHKPAGECEAADFVDYHHYPEPVMPPVNDRRISFLGEFGGIALKVKDHLWDVNDKNYGYIEAADPKLLERRYLDYMEKVAEFAAAGMGGSIYTQTTDVEREVNGLLTYDRKVLKFDKAVLKAAHAKILKAAGAIPQECPDKASAKPDGDVKQLSELLSIPSVSDDAGECDRAIEWMRSYLESRGVWCKILYAPEVDGRKVLYAATVPELKTPDYTFVTHLDVVAAASDEMFKPRLEGNILYARGACDTKANAFCGAKALVALNGKASVGCIFASNEEIGGSTTKSVLDQGYGFPKKAIIVLDSGTKKDKIQYSCMGCSYYKVTAYGKAGHASFPEICDNPIYALAEAAIKLRNDYPKREPGERKNCAAVTIIGGGEAQNRIPSEAYMTVNVRFVEDGGLEKERALIEKITGLKTEFIRGTPAACGDPESPVFLRICETAKKHYPDRSCAPENGRGANDMRWFCGFKGAIACLAMNLDGGHSDCEWCDVSDIGNFTDMLVEICK